MESISTLELDQAESSQAQSVAQSALKLVGTILDVSVAADNASDPAGLRHEAGMALESVVAAVLKPMQPGEAPVVVQGGLMELVAQRWV